VFSIEVNKAFYDDERPPMLAVVDVPTAVSVFNVVVKPLLTELVEPVAYLGLLLPWLERRTGRSWLAASSVFNGGTGLAIALGAVNRRSPPLGDRRAGPWARPWRAVFDAQRLVMRSRCSG
jgi:hypothetical protein